MYCGIYYNFTAELKYHKHFIFFHFSQVTYHYLYCIKTAEFTKKCLPTEKVKLTTAKINTHLATWHLQFKHDWWGLNNLLRRLCPTMARGQTTVYLFIYLFGWVEGRNSSSYYYIQVLSQQLSTLVSGQYTVLFYIQSSHSIIYALP